jgi:hypothetical protein
MTDQEINRALALAIGYLPEHVEYEYGYVWVTRPIEQTASYRQFDYKDWHTIGPIAAKYDCFPAAIVSANFANHKKQGFPDVKFWEVFVCDYRNSTEQNAKWLLFTADTPQKAIALAVIQGATTARALS